MQQGDKRPAGRPRSKEETRTARLIVLLTPTELDNLNRYVKANSLDRSAFIRNMIERGME